MTRIQKSRLSNDILIQYYRLIKPGIVYANLMTAAAGFLFGARGDIKLSLFLFVITGISFVIASACVFNNILDRRIDRFMKRTQKRATVTGQISVRSALNYGLILLTIGLFLLFWGIGPLVGVLGIIAVVLYVVVYGYFKRKSPLGTVVGALPGALPIVAGYVAATGEINLVACILFLILFSWQMPHFYAIAIYRRNEYAKAAIPVLPVKHSMLRTKIEIGAYLLLFVVAVFTLPAVHGTGLVYDFGMAIIVAYWIYKYLTGIKSQSSRAEDAWSRSFFGASLLVLVVFSLLISIDKLLPGML